MKRVNKRMSGEVSRKCGTSQGKSGMKKAAKKVVVYSARQMSNRTTKANPVPEIPGVDFLSKREMPSKVMFGIFYPDQIDMLVDMARTARDRARQQGLIFIAPEGPGFCIFKRKAVAK